MHIYGFPFSGKWIHRNLMETAVLLSWDFLASNIFFDFITFFVDISVSSGSLHLVAQRQTHSIPSSFLSVSYTACLTGCLIYSSKASVYYKEPRALCRVVLSNNNQWRQRLSVWAGKGGGGRGWRGEERRGGEADMEAVVCEKSPLLVCQLPLF